MRLNYTLLPVGSSEFIHLAQFREETESLARQSQTESRAFCVDCTCLVVITRSFAAGSAAGEPLGKIGLDGVDADPVLPHGIALPDGHRLVSQGVKVDSHAERGADLIRSE